MHLACLKLFFKEAEGAVRFDGDLTYNLLDVDSGTGQGDVQGLPILNLVNNLAS